MIKIISKITDKNAVREAKQKKSRGKESEICIQGKYIGTNETN